jgi:hypothetical protein
LRNRGEAEATISVTASVHRAFRAQRVDTRERLEGALP